MQQQELQILRQVSMEVAWKSQAAISLLLHRARHLDLNAHAARQPPSFIWPNLPASPSTEEEFKRCLQRLYAASDDELLFFRAEMEDRFRRLPYVQSLQPGLLPCQAFLVEVCKNLEDCMDRFLCYVWTKLIVQFARRQDPEIKRSGPLPFSELFLWVLLCRHHALEYRGLFPDTPLIPEQGERRNTHIKIYIETCSGRKEPGEQIMGALKLGRKLLAIETELECPGISLAMLWNVQKLGKMLARDLYQLIRLLGMFGQFPMVLDAGHRLTQEIRVYQDQFNKAIRQINNQSTNR